MQDNTDIQHLEASNAQTNGTNINAGNPTNGTNKNVVNSNANGQATTSNVPSTVTRKTSKKKSKIVFAKSSKSQATNSTRKNVPPTKASVQVGPAITSAYVAAYNTINATTRNTFKTMRDGKHIAGQEAFFVPRKSRTTWVNRKIDDMTHVGTQQSVNKT